jgi:hypothetical protein
VTSPVPDPWPDDEPTSIDVHLDRLEQLHQRIEGLIMAQDPTEADRIAEERMREANSELLRRLTEQVEANGGHKG